MDTAGDTEVASGTCLCLGLALAILGVVLAWLYLPTVPAILASAVGAVVVGALVGRLAAL